MANKNVGNGGTTKLIFISTNHILGKQGTTATDFFVVKSPPLKPSELPPQRKIN
jgi:hypothetical protein